MKIGLQLAQQAFGRADEVMHGRIAGAHFGQHFLGRDAAVHDPDAVGFPVLGFDFLQEAAQRRLVARVAGQHFVGERKALRRDHERDDHLRAVRALVAAVTVAPWVVFILGRVAFKIGARQVVEQDIEARVEEILPAPLQVAKERGLVREQALVARVELVDFGQAEIGPEEIGQSAALEPLAVQPPFAARRQQPVNGERLQHQIPPRPLAAGRQTLGEKRVEPELLIKLAGQPAGAPLARPPQLQLRQPNPHHLRSTTRGGGADLLRVPRRLGQQGHGFRTRLPIFENFDRLLPGVLLAPADFAEIKHVPLHHAPARHPLVFDDAPVLVLFAVFLPKIAAQEHDGAGSCPFFAAWE